MSAPILRRGLMLVLSSPSGAGKTTLSRLLLAQDSEITMSVSVTTRAPRPGEIDGKDYFFVDTARFEAMVEQNELLEHAKVFGNMYGTPKAPVEAALQAGRDVLFDIDWQGTQQLGSQVAQDMVKVFILPPSTEALELRLQTRAQDPADVVAGRMAKAADEMSHWNEYDYVVINVELEESLAKLKAILSAERSRRTRQVGLADFVNRLRGVD
ncbi:guanylate kinase [Emcibacter sp. SYSU 3D8]|uniref:guanylate kinase n=1 Tax=Emcibacter sp. SYSU 3D8 TaxID=3133969 RepID=UPI0031FF0B67